MKRSCHYRALALIVPLLVVGFFAMQPELWQNAGAAPKSEPVAIIEGPDFQVSVGRTITVDGSLSYDPSARKLHFNWELLEAPLDSSAKITEKNSATPSFISGSLIAHLLDSHLTYLCTPFPQRSLPWFLPTAA